MKDNKGRLKQAFNKAKEWGFEGALFSMLLTGFLSFGIARTNQEALIATFMVSIPMGLIGAIGGFTYRMIWPEKDQSENAAKRTGQRPSL